MRGQPAEDARPVTGRCCHRASRELFHPVIMREGVLLLLRLWLVSTAAANWPDSAFDVGEGLLVLGLLLPLRCFAPVSWLQDAREVPCGNAPDSLRQSVSPGWVRALR